MNVTSLILILISLASISHFGYGQFFTHYNPEPRFIFGIPSLFPISDQTCFTFDAQIGTCANYLKCISSRGRIRGKCNFGLKACCLPVSPVLSGTLIKDSPLKTSDSLTVKRISSAYCQVRVDFNLFSLDPVDKNGNCVNGRWTAAGQFDDNVPPLCGSNNGQHLYLNFDTAGTPIIMSVVTASTSSNWNIKTTQIACSDQQNLAPPGCLQYYPGPTGNIRSFNYINVNSMGNNVTYQPSRHDYIACIDKSTSTFSTITWTRDPSSDLSFSITGIAVLSIPFLGTVGLATFGENCTTDFVGISDGRFTNFFNSSQTDSKFCGLGFPSSVVSTPSLKPFALRVFTNADEITITPPSVDIGNVGFSLNFRLS